MKELTLLQGIENKATRQGKTHKKLSPSGYLCFSANGSHPLKTGKKTFGLLSERLCHAQVEKILQGNGIIYVNTYFTDDMAAAGGNGVRGAKGGGGEGGEPPAPPSQQVLTLTQ